MIVSDYIRKKYLPLIKEGKSFCSTTDNLNIMLINAIFKERNKTIFVCLPTLNQAQKYYDSLTDLLKEDCLFYPCDDLSTSEMIISSIEFRLERINTINVMLDDKPHVVVLNVNGLLKKQMKKSSWISNVIKVSKNDTIDETKFQARLYNMGYRKNYTVEKVGDYSVRGNIIDVFPLNSPVPIRIDLFGDDVDAIKEFDLNKQTSIKEIENVIIVPLNEIFYSDNEFIKAKEEMLAFIKKENVDDREYFLKDLDHLEKRENLELMSRYIEFFDTNESIVDFASAREICVINPLTVEEKAKKMISDLYEFSLSIKNKGINDLHYMKSLTSIYQSEKTILFNNMMDVPSSNSMNAKEQINYGGNESLFINDLLRSDHTSIIALSDQKRIESIKESFAINAVTYKEVSNKEEIEEGKISLVLDDNALSVDLYKDKIAIYTEENIYRNVSTIKRIRYKSVFGESKRLKSVDELKKGDYVVHYDYGIGIYLGLKTVKLENIERDYIHIMYANDDSIYVPIESIELVQKYSGREGYAPNLSTLGTKAWEKTKSRVKAKIKDISDKLIKLYAEREMAKGYAFLKDTPEQDFFENDFRFEETEDQLKAIQDVKKDMEKERPMDRLICGDVGYGKTEIAMRGAFKAIMSGKQVAYLAPTTMLTRQHYYTFKSRFEKFGARVALLNRFVSTKEQNKILKEIKTGEIDVLIGTHRILSKDIVFKDLGLLIIDEEQRFGVEHKERIKEMRVNVDTLTLTATPIPRTLQMSIMGIKDLSILNTPPKNRYPIQTYVLERNELIVKEAIERELSRNGQVFYLYNKTSNIEQLASKIGKLVPNARIAFAHGKMNKYELEDIIESFIEQEYDVLVCTTIIETGIDIPNTNTLIIHDANMLGLSQLYQIRGRVGRSDRIAYAYLMYDGAKILNEQAQKRLDAIKDFTELGSGYKIAMRDLSIRGAGDILGSEQSGFVDSVGIELYLKILEETINEREGKTPENKAEVGKALSSRHIPFEYIGDDGVRINIHKRIDALNNSKDLEMLEGELTDRFGFVDEKLNFYMYEKLFKKLAKLLGAESITDNKSDVVIVISEEASQNLNGEKLFMAAQDLNNLKISYMKRKIVLSFDTLNTKGLWVETLAKYLEKVIY